MTSGQVKFFPERYAKTYLDWLGEKRDWCISRQLWWGHRIPVLSLTFEDHRRPGSKAKSARMKSLERHSLIASYLSTEEVEIIEQYGETTTTIYLCTAVEDPELAKALESEGFCQDPDVLDTWFSSALWPHSTLGWPEQTPELKYYYPTSVLITNRDIITLWVARMVITGLYNCKQVPFHHVYIHPKILDGFGEGMSKSKGNGVDPLEIIERYGTDALRFGMVHMATETQDSRMPVSNACPHCQVLVPVKQEHMYMRTRKVTCPSCKQPFRPGGPWPTEDADLKTAKQASERFEVGRNFANKIWNAARFLLMNLEGYRPQAIRLAELPLEDHWILSRLAATTAAVTGHLEGYRFSEAARTIYDFTWSEFCDWYVEMSKDRLGKDEGGRMKDETKSASLHPSSFILHPSESRQLAQRVLVGVLDAILRLVQPIMPFVAESIWQALNEAAFERGLPGPEPAADSVVIAPWPELPATWKNPLMDLRMARMQELVRFVREVRNRYTIEPRRPVDVCVRCPEHVAADFRSLASFITTLATVGQLDIGPDAVKPSQAAHHVQPEFEAHVSLKGLIDVAAELKRLDKQLGEKGKLLQSTQAKLENASFVSRAPAEVVQQHRDQVVELQKQIQALEAHMQELGQG